MGRWCTVSMVTAWPVEAAELLPAGSVALAVMVWLPSVRTVVIVAV